MTVREVLNGSGGYTPQVPGIVIDPEVERDRVLLVRAIDLLKRRFAARAASGQASSHADAQWYRALKNMLRDIVKNNGRRNARLSVRTRVRLCQMLGLKELPPLPDAQVPEVLRHLPLKPPGVRGNVDMK